MKTFRLAFALALLSIAAASPALAESDHAATKEARALYEEGTKHYQVGEFEAALDAYKKAYFKKRDAVFLYNMAQCYRQLGKTEDAQREYRAYLRERPNASNRDEVEQFIADEEAELARRQANKPPTSVLPAPAPEPEVKKVEPPAVAAVVVAPEPPPPVVEKKKSKLWVLGVVAGVVVVGGAVGLGLAFGLPDNAANHAGSAGSYAVNF